MNSTQKKGYNTRKTARSSDETTIPETNHIVVKNIWSDPTLKKDGQQKRLMENALKHSTLFLENTIPA